LSAQPVWDEQATSTSVTPINETHRVAMFIGNGTMTVPDTGETINMTNNGTAEKFTDESARVYLLCARIY
jgi:hypothetical protein